ncbi:tetratricopeptide repeat protein [Prevotella sp. DNF00663]|uniref:tetratricopeptide repeat protein n=1 Tax=Prevotella sp. DNF00663 TaxID=1384078 RepID=UPI000798BB17|nr:tetratricopeptide repeat protein [Prevotella sp. DNF00663]KXB83715.1 tetratricopeptide repeat protein [Prevotella sp. DNF00663]
MKHLISLLAAFMGAAILYPALADNDIHTTKPKFTVDTIPAVIRNSYEAHFLEAARQLNANHNDSALTLLNRCIDMKPEAAEAYFLRSRIYGIQHEDTLAMADLQHAAALNPQNSTYQENVAQNYINFRQFDKAIVAFEKLYENNRDRSDVLNVLIQLYQHEKNYDMMLDATNRLELMEGNSEDMTLAKIRIYEMKGDKKSAFKVLKALCDAHPSDVNYRVMMGNWLMQNSKQKDAYKIFQQALKEEPDNVYAESSMRDYYRATGKDSLAHELTERILMSRKTSSQDRVTMMRQLIQESEKDGKDSMDIVRLFDRVLQHNPKDGDVAELAAAYMTLKKMPEDSVKRALNRVLSISPDNVGARLQLIQGLWSKKKWDDIIALCEPALLYNPDEMAFYYFKGLAYYQKENNDEALSTFRKGVSQINSRSNPDIVSDFYAIMGDILHQKGQAQESFAAYDSCLQWKSDNVGCLNNYAYYLSEEGQDLKRAEEMSFRTVKAEPKNSTFLDTYAWILFLQSRYEESKIYIDQAIKNDTDSVVSAVVLEHAGDIHAMCNEPDKAVDFWQQAVKAGSTSALIQKKLKLKKYIKE